MGTFKLALKTAKKANKNALFAILIIVLVILLASTIGVVFLVVKPVCDGVNDLSSFMGKTTGYSVAIAVESQLLPLDIAIGADEGHDEGLNADDTTVEVEKPIESLGAGTLEVLTADISLFESQTEGKDLPTGAYYAALYQFKGKIIFSIDLNEVDIKYEDQKVIVTIPQPSYRLTIDERNTEAIAVYQSVVGSVITSSSDGIISTLNTRTEMTLRSAELLDDYTELLSVAKESAEKQITALAEAVIINKTVEIRFQED